MATLPHRYRTHFAGIVRRPATALHLLANSGRLRDGAWVVLVVAGLDLLAGLLGAITPLHRPSLAGAPEISELPLLVETSTALYNQNRFLFPVAGAAGAFLAWPIGSALAHVTARLLRGRGEFRRYLTLTGYLQGVGLLAIPFSLLRAGLQLGGLEAAAASAAVLALLVQVAVLTWRVLLEILAAREVYRLTNLRATVAVLTPYTLAVVIPLAVLVWGVLTILTTGSLG
jgi:hypothetical protein